MLAPTVVPTAPPTLDETIKYLGASPDPGMRAMAIRLAALDAAGRSAYAEAMTSGVISDPKLAAMLRASLSGLLGGRR